MELPTIKPQLFILELCFRKETKESFLPAEVLLVEKDSEELEDLMEGKDARELEALAISPQN